MWFLVLLFIIILVAIKLYSDGESQRQGRKGEEIVGNIILNNFRQDEYHLIDNVTLPTWNNNTTQIDHIIVSLYGVFVIETKRYSGWIFGSEKSRLWTKVHFKNKYRFMNPLKQNYKHIMSLHEILGVPKDYFHSIIVFVGDAKFKTSMPNNVIYKSQLIDYIRNYQVQLITTEEIEIIKSKIDTIRLEPSNETDKKHISNLKAVKTLKEHEIYWSEEDKRVPICPQCGCNMKLRTNRKNGSKFWGCSEYPRCKQVINIVKK